MEVLFDQLDPETVEAVIAKLRPLLTDERVARMEATLAQRSRDIVIVLDDIANAHNAAAVLRTAEALGIFEVHVIEPEKGRFRVSTAIGKSCHKWLDIYWYGGHRPAVEALRARGFQIWVADVRGDTIPVQSIALEGPVALVFGNERSGVSQAMRTAADGSFMVPMYGFVESLNISVAAAIACYDVTQRKRKAQTLGGLEAADVRAVMAAWMARSVRAGRDVLRREGLPVPVMTRESVLLSD